MAQSSSLKWWLVIALLTISISCCKAQTNNAVSIVARAVLCFNNMTIYKNCQQQFRLTASGTLNVPKNSTSAFCSGPCMAETQLVLGCVDGIFTNFQFYNGATIQMLGSTIDMACGNTSRRGNFTVSQNIVVTKGNTRNLASSHLNHFKTLSLWVLSVMLILIL